MAETVELADYIANLREQLSLAILEGGDKELRFRAKSIDIELSVGVTHKHDGSGKLSFKVFGVGVEGGGGLAREAESINTLKLSLELLDAQGRSPLINAARNDKDY